MNELVDRVHKLLATDARTSVEPGNMLVFNDDKIRIVADSTGSMKVRVFDVETNERVFLGNEYTDAVEGQEKWVGYIDELLAEDKKALVGPEEPNEPAVVMPSAPEPEVEPLPEKEQEQIAVAQKRLTANSKPVDPVASLFPAPASHNIPSQNEGGNDDVARDTVHN